MTFKNISSPGRKHLFILAFISSFPPLSTDLYLPALPQIVKTFSATPASVNLSLSLFFVFFSIGTLFWGPLSEKYGRKPILYCGVSIYVVSSLLCMMAENCNQLVVYRIFQAFGGGAATAVATAMVKDLYSGKERATVLAAIMAMVIVAPVVAPILGSVLLKFASWRIIFLVLSGFGILALLVTFTLEESLEHRYQGSTIRSIGRLIVVLKNPGFSSLLCIFSIVPMPLMAFIAASSYVYIQGFGMSEQIFSLFFAANAVFAMLGPILYIKISKRFDSNTIICASFITLAASGLLVCLAGPFSPFIFAITMMPATLAMTAMRAPSANLMLEQQQHDTGSAASLINFFGMLMGSVGMMLISINMTHLILTIGIIQIFVGLFGYLFWLLAKNNPNIIQTS